MNLKLIAAGASAAAVALVCAAKDPVVMTVAGVDVPLSEFEYLYHKNSQQQIDPQPLDRYVEMFKTYKLKVADALAEGIDTTATFRREMDQYRRDLAAPYLADSAYMETLAREAYSRAGEEVEARHIMLFKGRDAATNKQQKARLDSIRGALLAGGDFNDLAKKYSQDRSAQLNGGNLGFVTINKFPYDFERAAFTLTEGEVSDIVESPMGYHLLVGGKHRPARGTVLASHIMKMVPPAADEAQAQAAKASIDSIYDILRADPGKFEYLAISLSDDKGSARNGGLLPWFGAGEMVEVFDSTAFALGNEEISAPVRSQYGWHIVKKINHKPVPSYAEMRPALLARVNNPQDKRAAMIREHRLSELSAKYNARIDAKGMDTLLDAVKAAGGLTQEFYAGAQTGLSQVVIASVGKNQVRAGELIAMLGMAAVPDVDQAVEGIRYTADRLLEKKMNTLEEENLYRTVPEYRNLLNEYRDGSLLYEVSLRKVWDKAAKDEDGLARYFDTHRGDYTWSEPRVKGYLVQASSDSVATLVRERLVTLGGDTVSATIRHDFPGEVQIDRVLVAKGANPMVDNLMFGGEPVQPSNSKYTVYFLYEPRVLEAPEEVSDVRGQVTGDYQNELEAAWIEELRTKYPVKVNEKVLRKVK